MPVRYIKIEHPRTKRWEIALFIPDYFSEGNHAIQFKDGLILNPKYVNVIYEDCPSRKPPINEPSIQKISSWNLYDRKRSFS